METQKRKCISSFIILYILFEDKESYLPLNNDNISLTKDLPWYLICDVLKICCLERGGK